MDKTEQLALDHPKTVMYQVMTQTLLAEGKWLEGRMKSALQVNQALVRHRGHKEDRTSQEPRDESVYLDTTGTTTSKIMQDLEETILMICGISSIRRKARDGPELGVEEEMIGPSGKGTSMRRKENLTSHR